MLGLHLGMTLGNPVLGGLSASAFAPFPAPEGFAWQFLTEDGAILTEDGVPLVSLEPTS